MAPYRDRALKPAAEPYRAADFALCFQCHAESPMVDFSGGYVAAMIFAESLAIAVTGGMLGIAASFPLTAAFAATVGSLLPSVQVSPQTVAMQLAAAAVVGVVAAGLPAWRAARISIVDGLRAVG
jgi:putative ABC transport system permease protein